MTTYRNDEDRLTDIIMGDAVLQLLQKSGPVTTRTLLDKLNKMAATEADPTRLKALRRAMGEVMSNMDTPEESTTQDADNVTPIFRRRNRDGQNTKH